MTMLLFVVMWIAISIAIGWAGAEKNRSFVAWFFLSLAISPLMAVLVLIAVPAGPAPAATQQQSGGWQTPSQLEQGGWELPAQPPSKGAVKQTLAVGGVLLAALIVLLIFAGGK